MLSSRLFKQHENAIQRARETVTPQMNIYDDICSHVPDAPGGPSPFDKATQPKNREPSNSPVRFPFPLVERR